MPRYNAVVSWTLFSADGCVHNASPRLVAGRQFEHFHNTWITRLCDLLNEELLPAPFFAAGELSVGRIEPDVLTFRHHSANKADLSLGDWENAKAVITVDEQPPQVAETLQADTDLFVARPAPSNLFR